MSHTLPFTVWYAVNAYTTVRDLNKRKGRMKKKTRFKKKYFTAIGKILLRSRKIIKFKSL